MQMNIRKLFGVKSLIFSRLNTRHIKRPIKFP